MKRAKKKSERHVNTRRKRTVRGHRAKRKRARSRFVFFTFLGIFTIGTLVTLSLTVFFFITDIKVVGNERYTSNEIISASGLLKNVNLFLTDTDSAQSNILKKFTYIEEAEVKRRLPSTVIVKVKETNPACQIVFGEEIFLIDKKGKILENTGISATEGIPYLVGVKTENMTVGTYLFEEDSVYRKTLSELTDTLKKYELMPFINTVNFTDSFSIKLIYDGRINIILGSGAQLDEKLSYFCEILKRLGPMEKGTLDLTNPDKVPFRPEH
jgi:cell division protein FtsQ